MKTTSLYVQFVLINVVKFNVLLNTAQTQSTMCRNCSCIIVSFIPVVPV